MPCDALIKLMLSLFYTTLNITATIHKLIVFSRSLCEEQREIDNRITNERLTPVIERENKAQTHPYTIALKSIGLPQFSMLFEFCNTCTIFTSKQNEMKWKIRVNPLE